MIGETPHLSLYPELSSILEEIENGEILHLAFHRHTCIHVYTADVSIVKQLINFSCDFVPSKVYVQPGQYGSLSTSRGQTIVESQSHQLIPYPCLNVSKARSRQSLMQTTKPYIMSIPKPSSVVLKSLPPEILQAIFLLVTTPSLLELCQTCWTFFNIASSSRVVLLHHLRRIPGIKLGLEDVPTKQLFLLLRRRAAWSLFGINFHADRLQYPFSLSGYGSIDSNASDLSTISDPNLAIVRTGGSEVHLYHATKHGIEPRLAIVFEFPFSRRDRELKFEIVKVRLTSQNSGVSILFKTVPQLCEGETLKNRFEHEAWEQGRHGKYGLVQFSVTGSVSRQLRLASFCDERDCDAFTFAVEDPENGTFAIGWRERKSEKSMGRRYCSQDMKIGLYWGSQPSSKPFSERLANRCSKSVPLAYGMPLPQESRGLFVSDLSFARDAMSNSQKLLVHPAGSLTYDLLLEPKPRLALFPIGDESVDEGIWRDNGLPVSTCRRRVEYKLGLPFFAVHEMPTVSPGQPPRPGSAEVVCVTKYLKIGFDVKEYCYPNDIYYPPQTAVIFCQSVYRAHPFCNRQCDLNTVQPADSTNKIIARLWGFHAPQTNKLGVIATSPQGTRIAIADWSKIMIWPLDPLELVDEGKEYFVDDETPLVTGKEYFERELNDHVKDTSTIALLRPVTLVMEDGAVVRQMKFAEDHLEGEDTLIVMTDRGMVVFHLGPQAKGLREIRTWRKPRTEHEVGLSPVPHRA